MRSQIRTKSFLHSSLAASSLQNNYDAVFRTDPRSFANRQAKGDKAGCNYGCKTKWGICEMFLAVQRKPPSSLVLKRNISSQLSNSSFFVSLWNIKITGNWSRPKQNWDLRFFNTSATLHFFSSHTNALKTSQGKPTAFLFENFLVLFGRNRRRNSGGKTNVS